MGVYSIYDDTGEAYLTSTKAVDGDFDLVVPIGVDFDPGIGAALMDDGLLLQRRSTYQGVPVDMSHLPTKVVWGGAKRKLTDIQRTRSRFLVRDNFRQVVERLEPGLHQFQPVELVWKDGSHAANFFWFNPCARVDGMDRDHTTHPFKENIGKWSYEDGKKFVVNCEQTAGHHVWIDPRTAHGTVFVSEQFRQAMQAAGVNGIGYAQFDTV